jgi:hypothetical protein
VAHVGARVTSVGEALDLGCVDAGAIAVAFFDPDDLVAKLVALALGAEHPGLVEATGALPVADSVLSTAGDRILDALIVGIMAPWDRHAGSHIAGENAGEANSIAGSVAADAGDTVAALALYGVVARSAVGEPQVEVEGRWMILRLGDVPRQAVQ